MRRGLVRTVQVLGLTLALSIVLAAVAPSAQARWTPRADLLTWMNQARDRHGAVDLNRVRKLREMADLHSRQMAYEGRIFHTEQLSARLRIVSWSIAGENVGVGPRLWALYEAFMKSDVHRANILQRGFERVGIGVYRADGFLWITLIFVG
jgi:uncharacterized protein YkwD